MALNLSRNTKVFVSSANGVPTAGGGLLTSYIQTKGSGYAVGDIVTLTAGGGSGANAKCIVLSISGSGAVETVGIPNNFRGNNHVTYASNNTNGTLTESAVQSFAGTNNSSASGLVLRVLSVSGTTTAEGARAGTGRFRGNSTACNTFRIGVLDGYSFSQGSESTDVTISEAGAAPNRGSKRFNDSLPPAEWSFGTYVRPFKHGAASWRASGTFDMVENILWSALAGTGLSDATGSAIATSTGTTGGALVDFLESDVHELMKLSIFFVLENTTYRLNDCQVNSAEIDFSIDGIAQISWSGNATTIDQVETAIEDPSKHQIEAFDADGSGTTHTSASTDTFAEGYNFADNVGPQDADYLRNKLSSLYLDTDAQGGGKASGGLDDRTYDINITGGSISIQNNITYVTPETIGIVDKPIGSFSGSRSISGTLNMYLDNKSNGSNQLLSDLSDANDLVSNIFDLRLYMGVAGAVGSDGDAMGSDDFTAPGVEFNLPKAQLSIPAIEVADLISVSVEFMAHGTDLLTGDEMKVKYLGSTTHSQTGYAATGSGDRSVAS
jgi:hypothetical protein